MTYNFTAKQQEQIIDELYARHDAQEDNIIVLQSQLSETTQGILDDVEALLRCPKSRLLAEEKLRDALQLIAQELI